MNDFPFLTPSLQVTNIHNSTFNIFIIFNIFTTCVYPKQHKAKFRVF